MTDNVRCDEFAERLADLLERDVDEATRAELEAHALACGECGPLLADMRKLRIEAASLPALAPSRDLWQGIAERIDAPIIPLRGPAGQPAVRRWRRWGSMAAAAAVLVALTSITTRYLTLRTPGSDGSAVAALPDGAANNAPREATTPTVPVVVAARPSQPTKTQSPAGRPSSVRPQPVPSTAQLVSNTKPSAEQVYASEIARLHAIVAKRRNQLDPVTISVIERNLAVIDNAIEQCKQALDKDPASAFLMQSLNNALETKVELLRMAALLPSRS